MIEKALIIEIDIGDSILAALFCVVLVRAVSVRTTAKFLKLHHVLCERSCLV